MKRRIGSSVSAVIIISILYIFNCTTQLAGPTTDVGNPQLITLVVDHNQNPISNADVSIFRMGQNIDSTKTIVSAYIVATGKTKPDGTCQFDNLVSGLYSIQGFETSGSATGVKTNINLISTPKTTIIDTVILLEPGKISGTVSRGAAAGNSQNAILLDAFIQVKLREIDLSFVTSTDGKYQFYGVPAGTYTLMYYASNGFYTSIRENIAVQSGQTVLVDSVILKQIPVLLPPKDMSILYDTSNGLVSLSWSKSDYTDLRWYEAERIDPDKTYSRTWHTTDTTLQDTVRSLPNGLKMFYVVRTVDNAFNVSKNSTPKELTLP
jgi:hypothetical protein